VKFVDDEDLATPWKRRNRDTGLVGEWPKSLTVTLANLIYFEKAQLPPSLANRLIRHFPRFRTGVLGYRAMGYRMAEEFIRS
jgi:hypothetical protein